MSNTRWLACLASLGLSLTAVHGFSQGSLTPPGAPAQTMRTLTQVEPRTPIAVAPYTITQSGSYYLTTNLVSTGHGIVIQTSRVTLDLMGFSITGDRDGGSDYGIWVNAASNGPLGNIVVRDGMVSSFGCGVKFDYTHNSRIESLMVSNNFFTGIHLNGDQGESLGNVISACVVSDNDKGIYLTALLDGKCNGNTVRDCTLCGNRNYGIYLQSSSAGECAGNLVAHCILRKNRIYGINIYGNGNRIENNLVSGTTGTASSYGIIVADASSQNLIVQNSCVGQTNNYYFGVNNTYGPIVTSSGALSTTNGAAALSPWANFSR